MRNLEFFTVCESVSMDPQQQTESLQNIVKIICIQRVPAVIHSLVAVASFFENDEYDENRENLDIRLEVIPPGVKNTFKFERTLDSQARFESAMFGVLSIPIGSHGDLLFKLFQGDELLDTHTAEIRINPQHHHLHPVVLYPSAEQKVESPS